MRILFITPVFYPADGFGGPVTVTYSLAKNLAELGHEVTVYTTNAKDFRSNMDIEFESNLGKNLRVLYFRNNARLMEWFISFSMINYIIKNRKNFDIIHVHSYRQFQDMMMYFVSKIYDINYAIMSHGYVLPLGRKTIFKKIYDICVGRKLIRRSRRIFALTQIQANEFQMMGASPEQIVIIPNGVDRFENNERGDFRRKLGIHDDQFVTLYLGRLHHLKGISFLIEGFSSLHRDDVHLVIAGPDYGYKAETRALIERSAAKDRIHLVGTVTGEAKYSIISESDFVVYPTLYDAFPMVPLEAASAGKPVILTDVCEFSRVLQKNNAGVIIQARNSEAITNAIEKLLDKSMNIRMGGNARDLIEREYLWNKIAQMYAAEYLRMLSQSA